MTRSLVVGLEAAGRSSELECHLIVIERVVRRTSAELHIDGTHVIVALASEHGELSIKWERSSRQAHRLIIAALGRYHEDFG